jgi:hypothetical protein
MAMMTCLELALTAQLICLSDHTPVCTDNGSIAQLIDVPACTSTEPSQPMMTGDNSKPAQSICLVNTVSAVKRYSACQTDFSE